MLCPGSRSGPLALAAGGLAEHYDLKLITAIDERSAAFLALGISTATGKATIVVTTSGSAVGNLLPAAIEADRSCQPVIFITADRPQRLKNCGANQTVNQEDFLKSVCRLIQQGPPAGLHSCSESTLKKIVNGSWQKCHESPGPVHCNLSFEEPLHASLSEQKDIWSNWHPQIVVAKQKVWELKKTNIHQVYLDVFDLDPFKPGIIIVGPWRGSSKELFIFKDTLRGLQSITSWPIFADPLSGVDMNQPGLIPHWEFLLKAGIRLPKNGLNVLRLGPLPSSRILESWLIKLGKNQIIITEGDQRYLDPLGLSNQWSNGLFSFWQKFLKPLFNSSEHPSVQSSDFLKDLLYRDQITDKWLEEKMELKGQVTEPALARLIPRLLPSDFCVMLSASSPVRDWISFGGLDSFSKRCFGFRGASGIDGTLSLAMGLSIAVGPMLLVTGDLALLHDSNGWLFANPYAPPLIVLLIDNGGGGIFSQLNLDEFQKGSLNKLFLMPQNVDPLALASAHEIPYRQISSLEDLEIGIEWAISLNGTVLLRVCTCPNKDNHLRKYLQDYLKEHIHMIIQDKDKEH